MNVTAVRNDQLDQDTLLGHLEFHTIADLKIHKDDLTNLFQTYGLDMKFMPDQIKPHDAFRRASATAGANNIQITSTVSRQARLLVREVLSDDQRIVRHLVREIVDKGNEVLDYATVGKMEYWRKSEKVVISWDAAYLNEYDYKGILEQARDLFEEWTQYHTKDTIRNIVSHIIDSMKPVTLMPRGRAQFVPKGQYDTLVALKNMVNDLSAYSKDECFVEIIPIIDTLDQRDLIARRLQSELTSEADKLLADFNVILTDRQALRMDTVQRFATKVTEMQGKAQQYSELLNVKLSVLEEQLRQALSAISAAPIENDVDPNQMTLA